MNWTTLHLTTLHLTTLHFTTLHFRTPHLKTLGKTFVLGLLACQLAAPAVLGADEAPYFRDVAEEAGVAVPHRTRSFENPYAKIMEGYTALGASVSVADVDGDGLEDVFVTDSSVDGRNILWRNVSGPEGLRFVNVADEAQVAEGNDARNASANSLFFDADNDGDPDLLVVRFGQNKFYENLAERFEPGSGKVRFRDVTRGSGLERYLNCITAIAFDYDLDGDLDLFLGNYFAPVNLFDPDTPRFFPESFETAANGGGVALFRNEGVLDGRVRFIDKTREVGLGSFSGWVLDLGHADIEHDGDDDLFVASDFGSDRLFVTSEYEKFYDVTERVLGVDTKNGMNADWGDFDGDGSFDLYVTNITDDYMNEGNFLWQNLTPEGGGMAEIAFADVARETGTHDTGWGWAGKFFDYDNDGLLDLYVVNGWVSGSEENYVLDIFELITQTDVDLADARNWPPIGDKTLSGYQRNRLFHNQGGLFVDEAARHGVDSLLDGRGVAVADFDQDGRQDLFVTNSGATPFLFRNVMPRSPERGPHWLQVRLEGDESNRDAVGARVRVTQNAGTQQERHLIRFVNGGNGFAGQSSRTLHFGLGEDDGPVDLRVVWPSGWSQTLEGVAVDRLLDLVERGAPVERPVLSIGKAVGGAPAAKPLPGKASDAPPPVLPTPSVLPAPDASPRQHAEQARAAEAHGDFDSALDHYELALAAEPGNLRWGSEYRQVAIAVEEYGRSLEFWKGLAEAHPDEPAVIMNLGFSQVDKIPAEGAVTQVILANKANQQLGRAIELMEAEASQDDQSRHERKPERTQESEPTLSLDERLWLAYYSRGNSFVYWPVIFGRTQAGIDDLRRALELAEEIEAAEKAAGFESRPSFRGRAWAALGDGYWRLEEPHTMHEIWRRGLERYPESVELRERVSREGADLDAYLGEVYNPQTRVATHLREIWQWLDAR